MSTFIGNRLDPIFDGDSVFLFANGEPVFPHGFMWKGRRYRVEKVLKTWKQTGKCTHASGERYVRRHWYLAKMKSGENFRLYFDRSQKTSRHRKQRWWLYSLLSDDEI